MKRRKRRGRQSARRVEAKGAGGSRRQKAREKSKEETNISVGLSEELEEVGDHSAEEREGKECKEGRSETTGASGARGTNEKSGFTRTNAGLRG